MPTLHSFPSSSLSRGAAIGSVIIPRCRTCASFKHVEPVPVTDTNPAGHYWSCRGCGATWATRDMSVAAGAA